MDDKLPTRPPRILVVDDDWLNRELLEGILDGVGYEVLLANSGDKALQLARSRAPDLILLDVRMPGMDGYTVCRQLKAAPATARIPVIIITGLEGEDDVEAARAAGADAVVNRMAPAAELLDRIRHLLPSAAM